MSDSPRTSQETDQLRRYVGGIAGAVAVLEVALLEQCGKMIDAMRRGEVLDWTEFEMARGAVQSARREHAVAQQRLDDLCRAVAKHRSQIAGPVGGFGLPTPTGVQIQ